MNAWLVALLLVVAALLAYATKPHERVRRWPKPGEGMRRRDRLTAESFHPERVPEPVRVATLPTEEAHVAAGFLEARGIGARLRPHRTGLARGAVTVYDLCVAEDRAPEAREVLDEVSRGRRPSPG